MKPVRFALCLVLCLVLLGCGRDIVADSAKLDRHLITALAFTKQRDHARAMAAVERLEGEWEKFRKTHYGSGDSAWRVVFDEVGETLLDGSRHVPGQLASADEIGAHFGDAVKNAISAVEEGPGTAHQVVQFASTWRLSAFQTRDDLGSKSSQLHRRCLRFICCGFEYTRAFGGLGRLDDPLELAKGDALERNKPQQFQIALWEEVVK